MHPGEDGPIIIEGGRIVAAPEPVTTGALVLSPDGRTTRVIGDLTGIAHGEVVLTVFRDDPVHSPAGFHPHATHASSHPAGARDNVEWGE